jgi:hypothetical protein
MYFRDHCNFQVNRVIGNYILRSTNNITVLFMRRKYLTSHYTRIRIALIFFTNNFDRYDGVYLSRRKLVKTLFTKHYIVVSKCLAYRVLCISTNACECCVYLHIYEGAVIIGVCTSNVILNYVIII